MGALREKMIAEMKLRIGQALSSVPRSTDAGTNPDLSFAFAGAGTVEQFR